jgi:hypothetical protein
MPVQILSQFNRTVAIAVAFASTLGLSSAKAEPMGIWNFESDEDQCSISTSQGEAAFLMMTTKSGRSGVIIKPSDPSAIDGQRVYELTYSAGDSGNITIKATAGEFKGVNSFYVPINAVLFAEILPDGADFNIWAKEKSIFKKDLRGSSDAFLAFKKCSAKYYRPSKGAG